MEDSYPFDDIEVVRLSEIHRKFISEFACQIKDLDDFVRDDALKQQEEAVNITYLWISKKDGRMLSYITLCNDSIHLFGEKKDEMRQIGISYKALPALKICRMAVHKDYARRGIGTKMLAFAINIALLINQKAGCRFLTLEAKNSAELPDHGKPLHFYKKSGFEVIKERKQAADYVPMYKDLKPIINKVRKESFTRGTVFDEF